jgi:hypothetical protein
MKKKPIAPKKREIWDDLSGLYYYGNAEWNAAVKVIRAAGKRANYDGFERAIDALLFIGIMGPMVLAWIAGRPDLVMNQVPVSAALGGLAALRLVFS